MRKKIDYVLAIGTVALAGWLVWLFVKNIGTADASVKAGLIGLFGMLTAALIAHYETKKREISARHFVDKREAYMQMIDLLFDFIMANKTGKEVTDEVVVKKIVLFKKSLMIWAGPEMIQVWNDYEVSASKQNDPKEMIADMEKVLRAIRKDLGHDDKSLKFGSLCGLILTAEDKRIALKDN